MRGGVLCVAVALLAAGRAWAQTDVPPDADEAADEAANDSPGYTPPAEGPGAPPPLTINGYVDVGFAKAQGNGTSFAPGDGRVPADYGVDPFAPAVNARGDVASTDAGGRFVNGFLPRSAGIGGNASFLLNTLDVDLKYTAATAPLMVFSRVQLLPRFTGGGDDTRLYVEQAFGRFVPFESQELALSVGKFDSVFGIEYLDNQANIRTGVTPSLVARYTTGQSIGAKLFYRIQLPAIWSAVSLNVAATNSGTFVEALQPPDASLTGAPVGSARLGYELNAAAVQVKLGASGMFGPRNDQPQQAVHQRAFGLDARVAFRGLYLSAEYVRVDEGEGGPKTTSQGSFPIASGFWVRGGYAQVAYAFPWSAGLLHKLTVYGRYDRRHAWFQGFTPITVDRFTGGLRFELWDSVLLKAEYVANRELAGAPTVANNVFTSSLVYSF
ncbi:MAG TPA: hypothetical protein VN962_10620 [Polyangia bacterium]|nr:hypothetical protein [Polyangia bacterium]